MSTFPQLNAPYVGSESIGVIDSDALSVDRTFNLAGYRRRAHEHARRRLGARGEWSTRAVDHVRAKGTSLWRHTGFPVASFTPWRRLSSFVTLQKWEGIVERVIKDSFVARLIDLTEDNPYEEATFSFSEVSPDDRALLKPGAVFYWNIGYNDAPSGNRTRVSMIRFRRIPSWSRKDLETANQEAKEVGQLIGWK